MGMREGEEEERGKKEETERMGSNSAVNDAREMNWAGAQSVSVRPGQSVAADDKYWQDSQSWRDRTMRNAEAMTSACCDELSDGKSHDPSHPGPRNAIRTTCSH
ncbi:hypothetical protein N7541_004682 [Penicillium brevicompactum]|uniref:Uncharacterized protein n=1 Tax=Penicillium brevicompactum TaxID=5074 RepID=A0A9W9RDY2_PENBR|nr:hypothetical protein N7541_004682 [Penicillium brevicompactum]